MAWQSFLVRPRAAGAAVDEKIRRQLELALAIRLPLCAEVAVLRRDRFDTARYYFSDAAVELFKTLVQFHGGEPCAAPGPTRGTVRILPVTPAARNDAEGRS